MDFHRAFEHSVMRYPALLGIVFVDPDGEAILYEAPGMDAFELKLAGAKLPLLMDQYLPARVMGAPRYMEILHEKRYILSVCLDQRYSITAVHGDTARRGRLRQHVLRLSEAFNQEIV